MAITFVGSGNNPADSTTYGVVGTGSPTALAVTPPSMIAGDLAILSSYVAQSSASRTLTQVELGGQTWTTGGVHQGTTGGVYYWWWCTFNGTWTGNPSVIYSASGNAAMLVNLTAFRPTNPGNSWSIDVAASASQDVAPSAPFDVTVTGQTPIQASSVTLARWLSMDDNTWALQTGGWSQPQTQWRSFYDTAGSMSLAYKIQTSAAATGDVTNRESQAEAHWKSIVTFAESGQATYSRPNPMNNPIYRM